MHLGLVHLAVRTTPTTLRTVVQVFKEQGLELPPASELVRKSHPLSSKVTPAGAGADCAGRDDAKHRCAAVGGSLIMRGFSPLFKLANCQLPRCPAPYLASEELSNCPS